MSSLPTEIIEDAKQIAASLDRMKRKNKPKNADLIKKHATFTLATKLIQVVNNSRMDEGSLKSYLKHLRKNYDETMRKAMHDSSSGLSSDTDVDRNTTES